MTIYADKNENNPIGCISTGKPLYCQKLNPNIPHDFLIKIEFDTGQILSTD